MRSPCRPAYRAIFRRRWRGSGETPIQITRDHPIFNYPISKSLNYQFSSPPRSAHHFRTLRTFRPAMDPADDQVVPFFLAAMQHKIVAAVFKLNPSPSASVRSLLPAWPRGRWGKRPNMAVDNSLHVRSQCTLVQPGAAPATEQLTISNWQLAKLKTACNRTVTV